MTIQRLKNLLNKINIHPLFYVYLILYFIYNQISYFLIMMSFVLIHEFSHFIMAFYFRFRIKGIRVYPFGSCLLLDDFFYKDILKELCVVLAGPCVHLFIELFLVYLVKQDYLISLNRYIFFFNILPVYPLDGNKVIILLFQSIGDLKKAMYSSLKISVLSLSLLSVFYFSYQTIIIIIYLFYNQFVFYKFIKFYLCHYLTLDKYENKRIIHHNLYYRRGFKNYYMLNNHLYDELQIRGILIREYLR